MAHHATSVGQRSRIHRQGAASWLAERGAKTIYITPGSPWENGYIESFNDTFRDECLNMHVFTDGRHAQEAIEAWRNEYNNERPHSSLNCSTPSQFGAPSRFSARTFRLI